MGNILNPGRENSFTRLVKSRKTEIFIDKTDFLEVMSSKINDEKRFFAVTRPRRFGKTVTAHMLSAYFSKGYAGQNIFDGLEITHKDSFPEHLNKYDVIYIDMNSINSRYNNYLKNEKVHGVASLADYLEYSIITELREQQDFAACFEKHNIKNTGLLVALSSLQNDLNAQFIFIMDEWDLVCREYRNDEQLQKDYIDLLKDLFKTDDGQACFVLAYLTGILPIKKYNSQSALNTFLEYNMLEPEPFERYFGFTETETAEIAARPSCKLSQEELKDWYEGYRLNGIDIYNPNSVVSAVQDGRCKSYWSRSSSNEEVAQLINMNYAGVKSDILNLIEGGRVQFDTSNFQNDMVSINSKDDVLCLLAYLGYVGCESVKNSDVLKIAYVPNKEIRSVLTGIVRKQNWYERMDTIERSENLLKAIKSLDGNKTAELIQEIHNSPAVSLLDYNDEESLTYCVMTGLLWSTLDDYTCHREEQAGKGKVDLVYEPNIKGAAPLILIEFKYGKSAEEALKQIKTQEYFRRYTKLYTKNILLAGINYDPKSKNHQCLIEKLN
ncbi:MAG: AAA family ATPase [Succinimonas sp.]|nr:AAA family ATPase [Succinimonas sp.]